MKIVTTFHQPSSVVSSVKCQLSSRDREHLVVAKLNRIDVYSLDPDGLKHQCGLEIWGKALCIKSIPIADSSRSNLVLLTAHPDPELIFLKYTEAEGRTAELIVQQEVSLYERTPRPAEFFNDVLIHPSGNLAVVSCYTGKLKIVNLKTGGYESDFDVSMRELNVLGLAFLPIPEHEFALAILHLDTQGRVQLLARDLIINDLELSSQPSILLPPTSLSSKIIPFPMDAVPKLIPAPPTSEGVEFDDEEQGFLGGVLIVGGRKILLYEVSGSAGRAKQKGKQKRLESRLKSSDAAEVSKAMQKEKEREARIRKAYGSVEWPWGEVTALCAVSQNVPRFFIGDSFGKLSMLSVDDPKTHGLILIPLGETSPATTLTYLTNQKIFLGSHLGDSQLLHISQTPTSASTSPTLPIPEEIKVTQPSRLNNQGTSGKGKAKAMDLDDDGTTRDISKGAIVDTTGSFVEVLDTFKNIAPIMDAVIVDPDGSGQKQVVTCSGGANTGSINVLRSGADFQELASIPGLQDVTHIWGIKNQFEDELDSHLFVSTLHGTKLYRINDTGTGTTFSEVAQTEIVTTLPTIAFGNVIRRVSAAGKSNYVNSSLVVQVTRQGAQLFNYDPVFGTFTKHATGWSSPAGTEVVAASVNPSQVLMGLSGGRLVALTINPDDDNLRVVVQGALGSEISAVSCMPLDPTKFFSHYAVVSYWESKIIEVFIIDTSGFVSLSKSAPLPALARSVILHNFGLNPSSKGPDYHPYVLAGLSDGSVVYLPWKDKQLKDRKTLSLGQAPVTLAPFEVDGKRTIFAAGSRASVFSWERNRLRISPIMFKDVLAISRLNTTSFQKTLILSTLPGLFIGRVRELDKMNIRSVPFGLDNPQRIAHEPTLRVFGVACTRTEPVRLGDPESSKSSFRLLDDTAFSNLASFDCDFEEEIRALVSFSPTIGEKRMPLFCLGTYIYVAEEKEPTQGRVLVFTAQSSQNQSTSGNLHLPLIASAQVRGCVYALTIVKDMIVAAVNSSIMLYQLKASDDEPSPTFSLQLLSEWNHNYLVTSIASYGDHIMAGDQISSVSLLQVVDSKLQNIARDYGPLWPVCVEAFNEESIIGANDALNLFTFTLGHPMGRVILERDGGYHLAELVTKFVRGSITGADTSENHPALEAKHVFFTSSGRVGVVVDVVDATLALHLTDLQRNLANAIKGVGGESHTRFRAPKNTRGRSDADQAAFGFLDGDFLEQFLARLGSPEQLDKVIAGNSEFERLTVSAEDLQRVLENLQSMH